MWVNSGLISNDVLYFIRLLHVILGKILSFSGEKIYNIFP